MSIEIHCPACNKLIRAPESAAGRHGKCPHCEHRVYVPMPPSEDEEIKLAPIDQSDEEREAQLRREAIAYAATLAKDKSAPPAGPDDAAMPAESVRRPEPVGEVIDIGDEVEKFILAMRDSRLDKADEAVATLKRTGSRARDYVSGLLVDEIPPEIENVPPGLLKGFLKTLISRLG